MSKYSGVMVLSGNEVSVRELYKLSLPLQNKFFIDILRQAKILYTTKEMLNYSLVMKYSGTNFRAGDKYVSSSLVTFTLGIGVFANEICI